MADAKQRLLIDVQTKNEKALGRLNNSVNKLSKSTFSLGSAAKLAMGAMAAIGAVKIIKSFIKVGHEVESLNLRFKYLFGSAEEGSKAFQELNKYAATVPFSLDQIAAGSGNLATVAGDAKGLAEIMEITGNVAAISGLDFKTASEQIQRTFSAGINAADLFRDKGVKAMLGFKDGVKYSIEESQEVFRVAFGKGGRFANASADFAKTLAGQLSMIGDSYRKFQEAVSGAFFDELVGQTSELGAELKKNEEKIKELGKALGEGIAKGIRGLRELIPLLQMIGGMLKTMWDGYMALPPVIREMGFIGAFVLGKKGMVAFAAVTTLLGKITKFVNETDIKAGIYDPTNLDEVAMRLKEIDRLIAQGTIEIERQIIHNNGVVQIQKEQVALSEEMLAIHRKEKALLEGILKFNEEDWEFVDKKMKAQQASYEAAGKERLAKALADAKWKRDVKNNEKSKKASLIHQELLNQSTKETVKINEELGHKYAHQITSQELLRSGIDALNGAMVSAFTDAIMRAKSFDEALRSIANVAIRQLIQGFVQLAIVAPILGAIKKFLEDIGWLQAEHNKELKKTLWYETAIAAVKGIASFFGVPGLQHGGPAHKGQPYMVGEAGPEMFVPNTSGTVVPNNQLGGGGGGEVNVNFNINAVDGESFDELLLSRKSLIVGTIQQAFRQQGRRFA